ncbi:hypothetical protein Apa02nite_007970 [Actinoplanes palleronii]|uniref:Transposase n=1 Tax=Actinoplanes palleronii TaxID=113570 RepID=A0ABQ4B1Z4_9ACTN|nr:hypothetical protein Apa02nite_007970 [Actinoplanes palleronii]
MDETPLELAKRTGNGSPVTAIGWFAWCNVRPTPRLTCVFMLVRCGIARTGAVVRGELTVGLASRFGAI